ncbi:hypothetical protein BDN72DRAFT_860612 [Pluteus cervinus]|uniref:Uncharacterized protein n=1 Tax=Pluteus cervinus TaxID=181527 RepID=A0ACD3AJ24_9AGAR|nr:hypothetical protein BDN72DRAFT_860612 [Pluteus cervinus]
MVSFKAIASLSVLALGQQVLAQSSLVPIPAGFCYPCLGPVLASSSALVARPSHSLGPAALNCCRLWYNSGLCLPECPIIPILDPLPTPILITDPAATPFSG